MMRSLASQIILSLLVIATAALLPAQGVKTLRGVIVHQHGCGEGACKAGQFTGDSKSAVWLPNERIAKAWAEYVNNGNVSDPTPPPAPSRVRLGEKGLITWDAEADLESGIAAFVIERNSQEVGRVQQKPAGTIGRRVFQQTGYSDTPTPPLAEMQFIDTSAEPGTQHRYEVFTPNSVGLKSKPASLNSEPLPNNPQPAEEPASPTTADISRAELLDRIHGGWAGMLIGGLEGLPHEFKYKEQPRDTLPEFTFLENGARSDDDNDFEWPHLYFMDKEATLKLPYPRIVEIWKANMNSGIWIANKKARELMDQGVVPPETGSVARNPAAWYNLSGQFCVESYGLIAPGMPQSATDIGLHYTRIAVSEEPLQAAQFWSSLIALRAFHQGPIDDALQQATAAVDPKSAMAEVVADTRKAFQTHPDDWKAARQEIDAKWRVQRKWNHNSTPVNGAAVCLALLYGRDDFYRTLQYAMALGYDADCNAATAGTIAGVRQGFQQIASLPQFKMPDHYVNKTRPQLPAECKVSEQAETLLRVAERVILANGGEKITVSGQPGYRVKLQQPQLIEPLPEKVHSPDQSVLADQLAKDGDQQPAITDVRLKMSGSSSATKGSRTESREVMVTADKPGFIHLWHYNGDDPLVAPLLPNAEGTSYFRRVSYEARESGGQSGATVFTYRIIAGSGEQEMTETVELWNHRHISYDDFAKGLRGIQDPSGICLRGVPLDLTPVGDEALLMEVTETATVSQVPWFLHVWHPTYHSDHPELPSGLATMGVRIGYLITTSGGSKSGEVPPDRQKVGRISQRDGKFVGNLSFEYGSDSGFDGVLIPERAFDFEVRSFFGVAYHVNGVLTKNRDMMPFLIKQLRKDMKGTKWEAVLDE